MRILEVSTASRRYPIVIGREHPENLAREAGILPLPEERHLATVCDQTVWDIHGEKLAWLIGRHPLLRIPSGEGSKSARRLEECLEFLAECGMDRHSRLIALGGGVIGDLAGFTAASFLRGIRYFQVPTTLLAMVDSSVGGKTGINLKAGKNLAGAFHQPDAVLVWLPFLETLPPREFAAGMAEVIKYGLLADGDFFHFLENQGKIDPGSAALDAIVERCCEIKSGVVAADERETSAEDGRALLNLGHTFAHAVEKVAGYGTYLHGEAVALGLLAAARLSHRLGHVPASVPERTEKILEANDLPTRLRAPLSTQEIVRAMARDKKMRAGVLRVVVLHGIGEARTVAAPDDNLLGEVVGEWM